MRWSLSLTASWPFSLFVWTYYRLPKSYSSNEVLNLLFQLTTFFKVMSIVLVELAIYVYSSPISWGWAFSRSFSPPLDLESPFELS